MTAEQTQQERKTGKRTKKRVWLAVMIVVILAIVGYLLLTSQSAEEQLAAIEAARAIPDSQNAATIYNELLARGDDIPMLPDFLDEETDSITLRQSWQSEDYPDLAKWLKERQETIAKVLEATKLDKCIFPIPAESYLIDIDRNAFIRQWAYLLSRAANNDIGQGRTDAAVEKYLSVTRVGMHISQQPIMIDYLVGVAVEMVGLQGLNRLVMETELTEIQLKAIQEFPFPTQDNWAKVSEEILQVENLLSRKSYSPLTRLGAWWSDLSLPDVLEQTHDIYLRTIAKRRALKVIIALRRCKNRHGPWPEALDDINSLAPPEVFVDPINNGTFVYKLSANTVKFYSKGKNKIDEDGRRNSTFDPKSGQIIQHEDDILFWPPKMPKKQEENTNGK